MISPAEVARAFEARFSRQPSVMARSPGRINLIGEHTDYNDGFALPMAIDREVAIAAAPAGGESSTLFAANLGCEAVIDLRSPATRYAPDSPLAFANHVIGVIEEFRRLGSDIANIDLLAMSDLPIGAGLSSSAAVEVATATIMESLTGPALDPIEKAMLCQRAEHRFVGTPCGLLDQYAVVFGEAGSALLLDCQASQSSAIPLPQPSELAWRVADTGVRRSLADGRYADRRASCERVARALGVPALRHATVDDLDQADVADTDRLRASHVVLENVRTLLAATALHQGDLAGFCTQMFEGHRSLRDLFDVSCPELDVIVDAVHACREETGEARIGARMTGAGFGGCAVVACPAEDSEGVERVIRARFRQSFGRDLDIFPVRPSAGAREIEVPN